MATISFTLRDDLEKELHRVLRELRMDTQLGMELLVRRFIESQSIRLELRTRESMGFYPLFSADLDEKDAVEMEEETLKV